MLHLVQRPAPPTQDKVLSAMFAARKSVFVDLLKWDVPVLEGRFEVDQFDDGHAHYLILTDPDEGHLGSARLLPTIRPHILGNLYPFLCDEAPPCAPGTFEITRFCLDRRLTAGRRRQVRDTLVWSLAVYALECGIERYTAIAEMGWYQQILAFGWRCRPLGLPQRVDGHLLAALRIEIDADTPALLASAGIVADPSLLGAQRRAAA